jgi:hypothetical protein
MYSQLRITLCLGALLLAACDPITLPCIDFEGNGACGHGGGGFPPVQGYIIGFPTTKLDTSATQPSEARGVLRVGDSITLYVVTASGFPNPPFDTLTNVVWYTDTSTAQISTRADGGRTLVAKAPGRLVVAPAGVDAAVWACDIVQSVYGCSLLGEIDVLP